MIEVSCLKDLKAAKLFLGFRIGAISRRDFAVFPVQGQRGLRRLKRYFGNKMSVGAQMVVVLKAIVEHCVSLALSHPFKFSWREVSQADVFHPFLPLSCDSLFPVIRAVAHRFGYQIALPQKSIGAVTSFMFSSCDFVDRSFCPEKQERSTKSHEPRSPGRMFID